MLSNLRNFAKSKMAGVLVGIIIIPFVFWGMGGLFSGGNTNNIAKINNNNISTQDFMDHLNSTNITSEKIKNNIDKNVIEEMLSSLISNTILSMEIKDLDLIISDQILSQTIKKKFLDEENKFSRTKYEKFLLSSNLSAAGFEQKLKNNELKNNLLLYISGGIKSPYFLTNKIFKQQTKKIKIDYLNLENLYRKDFTTEEILNFVEENKESLKEKSISFNYSKLDPKSLIGVNEYNKLFFSKIDEIENEISNNIKFNKIIAKYKLQSQYQKKLKLNDLKENENDDYKIFKKIYENSIKSFNKAGLLEENDYYVLYEIDSINEELPNIKDNKFVKKIEEALYNKSKYKFNQDLISKISEKKFDQENFEKISNDNNTEIKSIEIQSINDNNKFSTDSVKFLYSLPKNSFSLVGDNNKNIYLVKIINIFENTISKNSTNYNDFNDQANVDLRDNMFSSYDFYLNEKYKVKINQKTLDRVKNYFK